MRKDTLNIHSAAYRRTESGFTLVEVAIVVLIFGIITANMISIFEKARVTRDFEYTQSNLAAVEEAIRDFALRNPTHAYPCPAPNSLNDIDGGSFGTANCGTCSGNICTGSVPTRTLMIADSYMLDSYGNRLTYTVSRNMTGASPSSTGVIKVQHDSGGTDNGVHFVVLSHGEDASGAITRSGTAHGNTCRSASVEGKDRENCNGGDTFFETSLFSRKDGANQYDDELVWNSSDDSNDMVCIYKLVESCAPPWDTVASSSVPKMPGTPQTTNYVFDVDHPYPNGGIPVITQTGFWTTVTRNDCCQGSL